MFTGEPEGRSVLAWDATNLSGAETIALSSPDFEHGGVIPAVHASPQAGGRGLSPALAWTPVPEGATQLLLVVEDPDAPMAQPFIHCLALLDASLTGLAHGALDAASPAEGVRLLRSTRGSGYIGPTPPKSHGPHRYVFQIFALAAQVGMGSKSSAAASAPPRKVLAAASDVLSRGRLDGFFQRT